MDTSSARQYAESDSTLMPTPASMLKMCDCVSPA